MKPKPFPASPLSLPVFLALPLLLLILSSSFALDPSKNLLSSIISAENVNMPFFSSRTGERFALLSIGSIDPARRQIGPFAIAAPGHEIQNPKLEIISAECDENDWLDLLSAFQKILRKTGPKLTLTLPDQEKKTVRLLKTDKNIAIFPNLPTDSTEHRNILLILHNGEELEIHHQPKSFSKRFAQINQSTGASDPDTSTNSLNR